MTIARFAFLWVVFAAIEVLLVGTFDVQETPVGIVVAAIAAWGTVAALNASGERYRFRVAWLGVLPRLVVSVVRDTFLVFGALLRRLAGGPLPDDAILEIPFAGRGDDPEANAHRALGIAAVSFAPNSIVLDVDADRTMLRVHYLLSGVEKPASAEWPV